MRKKHGTIDQATGATVCLLLGMAFAIATEAAADTANEQGGRKSVLGTTSHWRCFTVLRDSVAGPAKSEREPPPPDRFSRSSNSPLPPKNWKDVEFDDTGWVWTQGPFYFHRTSSQSGGFGFHIPR